MINRGAAYLKNIGQLHSVANCGQVQSLGLGHSRAGTRG
jgi:hypothetical protein